jgi:hypothetical protein
MANGAKARYRIPAFRALAGLSPSCCAERVQMEHCARAGWLRPAVSCVITSKTKIHFFIKQTYCKAITIPPFCPLFQKKSFIQTHKGLKGI